MNKPVGNIFNATPASPAQPLDFASSRAALNTSNNARMNIFQANGNTWTPQPQANAQPDPTSPEAITDATVKGIPSAALNMGKNFLSSLLKFGKSAATAPGTIASGGKKVAPGTYEADASKVAGDVVTGKAPVSAALGPIADTVGEGATIATIADPEILDAAKSLAEKGFGTAADIAKTVSDAGSDTIKSIAKALGKGSDKELNDAMEVIRPKLTAKETEQALAAGRGQGGGMFSKTKIALSSRDLETADAVKGIVRKGATGATNIAKLQDAIGSEAENLKTEIAGVDHPYSFRELNKAFNDVEAPISIKGTAFEKQIDAVKAAAMDISQKNGGTVSSLLDSRKEFDALVSKEYPNLYDKENAPMRNAITAIRNTMNDFIEKNLPDDVSFKASLKKQSLYYNAIDNIAGKAVEETKTTGAGRLLKTVKNHPIGAAATGAGAYEVAHKVVTGDF